MQPFSFGWQVAGGRILPLAARACEPQGPAREDVLRRVDLSLAHGAQEDPDALNAVLLPGGRRRHHRDEVVEARPVDGNRHSIAESREAKAAVRILGGAAHQEGLPAFAARLCELLCKLLSLVEAQLPAGDPRPELLLVLGET